MLLWAVQWKMHFFMVTNQSASSYSHSGWFMGFSLSLFYLALVPLKKFEHENGEIWGISAENLELCSFSASPSLLFHPHRACLMLWSCHLAESRVWRRGDSMVGLREATELHSSVSPFYHPALSVPGCQTIYYYIYSLSEALVSPPLQWCNLDLEALYRKSEG